MFSFSAQEYWSGMFSLDMKTNDLFSYREKILILFGLKSMFEYLLEFSNQCASKEYTHASMEEK